MTAGFICSGFGYGKRFVYYKFHLFDRFLPILYLKKMIISCTKSIGRRCFRSDCAMLCRRDDYEQYNKSGLQDESLP